MVPERNENYQASVERLQVRVLSILVGMTEMSTTTRTEETIVNEWCSVQYLLLEAFVLFFFALNIRDFQGAWCNIGPPLFCLVMLIGSWIHALRLSLLQIAGREMPDKPF